MTVSRRDLVATGLTLLAVLVFAAVHEGWGAPLVGDSVRWATAVILVLGMATCSQGSPGRDRGSKLLGVLGVTALVLAVVALVTASLTALSLLVLTFVVLWAVSTWRHTHQPPRPAAV
jgi:hypothetical protein